MTTLRKWFRRLRTLLWTALTLVIIGAAVVVGIGKLLMPYSVKYKPQLETWLEKEFNQPVRLDSFSGEWKAFGPRISLEGLSLLGEQGGGAIAIQQAALDIKPLNALIAGRPLYSFRIIGADLSLVRSVDGRFELSGLGVSGRGGGQPSGLSNLARVGEVRLEDSNLSFDDDERDIHLQLSGVQGALQMKSDELALEVQASVSDGRSERILGDLGATVFLSLDENQRLASARWHLETGELMVSEFGKQLPDHDLKPHSGWLNAELWGEWTPEAGQQMDGVLDVREIQMDSEDGPVQVEHLNALFRWRFMNRRQWRLDLADVEVSENERDWGSPRISVERNIPGGLGVWVSADSLQAELPLLITHQAMGTFNARWPRVVPRRGRGSVTNFDLVISSDKKLVSATAEFTDLEAWDWQRFPNIAGVSGNADMAFGEGGIELSGESVRLDWPGNFREPAIVDVPLCRIGFGWGARWQVDVHDCSLENEAIRLAGRTRVAGNEGKPAVDVNVAVERADLGQIHDYWPQSLLKPAVTGWLQRALRAGEVAGARFVLQGDMDDWPFRGGEGTLSAWADVRDARLDYHPGWPEAVGLDALVRFEGAGMRFEGMARSLGGAPLDWAQARIDDFQAPRLDLEYRTRAELPALMDFIEASPLLDDSRLELERLAFTGAAQADGRLTVPLKSGGGEAPVVEGSLTLSGNTFTERESALRLENLAGKVRYTAEGIHAEALDVTWNGFPARLSLAADWDAPEPFSAELLGRFPVTVVVGESPLRDDPLLTRADGETDWSFRFSVRQVPDQEEREIRLHVVSDLEGVTFGLPSPLNKAPQAIWPLAVDYPIQSARPELTARLGNLLSVDVETGASGGGIERAVFHFGPGRGEWPSPGTFDITGQVTELDVDAWMDVIVDYMRQQAGPERITFGDARLAADTLIVLNRRFDDVALEANYSEEILRATFHSTPLAGSIRYSRTAGVHSLAAEMERLILPDPVDQGMTMDSDPTQLPEMHLYVKEFSYLGLDMGETRIEAYPLDDGLRIESVEARSAEMNFQARGDWTRNETGSRSDFDIVMTSESLGALVSALDLSTVLEGGQTMVHFDAWWPGPPAAFALAVLNGEMTFSVIDGNILNADPGAGRMLGLISLTELPRRLALDFRDVFDTGFNFDQASGTLRLENGTAHTNDFVLESTAATMTIVGSSDLVAEAFDYEMAVRPGVSQALPVIGALAAGPGGAAAGLALQGLLKDALGDAAEARYAITGSWQEPRVERLPSVAPTPEHFPPTTPNEESTLDE